MPSRTHLASLAAGAAIALAAAQAPAETCTPVRVGPSVAAQPEAWRRAVEALVQSTATVGLPWACAGGQVDLVAGETGAMLTVTDASGHAITRPVANPDDVQPLGEALLARPLPPPPNAEPPAVEAPAVEAPAVEAPAVAAPLPGPRVLVSAIVAPRYAGKSNLLWGGATLDGTLQFGRWGAGLWVRYDGPSVALDRPGSLQEVCFGAAASRGFDVGPVELRASVRPSAAVLIRPGDHAPDDVQVDLHIGADARAIIPFTKVLRAVVAFDAELAPLQLGDGGDHDDHRLPLPAYTLGLGAGLEVAIR